MLDEAPVSTHWLLLTLAHKVTATIETLPSLLYTLAPLPDTLSNLFAAHPAPVGPLRWSPFVGTHFLPEDALAVHCSILALLRLLAPSPLVSHMILAPAAPVDSSPILPLGSAPSLAAAFLPQDTHPE